jgi:hypothetical protein
MTSLDEHRVCVCVCVQESRILTPILFSLLLLIVFFVWVNVMVAIISEVYDQECDRSMKISWDTDFQSMAPNVMQPENDMDAMQLHVPAQTHPGQAKSGMVALTPEKCAPRVSFLRYPQCLYCLFWIGQIQQRWSMQLQKLDHWCARRSQSLRGAWHPLHETGGTAALCCTRALQQSPVEGHCAGARALE